MSDPLATPAPRPLHHPGRITVVGAGIVGRCCALQLARLGHAVTLLDPDTGLAAPSWGNAGHIAIEQTAPLASPASLRQAWRRWYRRGGPMDMPRAWSTLPWTLRFVAASRASRFRHGQDVLGRMLADALPAWRRLDDLLGGRPRLQEQGHLVVWEDPAHASAGLRHWQSADIGTARLRPLAVDERRLLTASLAHTPAGMDGIAFEGSAQIRDPYRLAGDLDAALAAHDVRREQRRVLRLERNGLHATVVTDQGAMKPADRIVVCAGVDSRRLLQGLGASAPLIAERGYHLQWQRHNWPSPLPPVVFEDRSIILTRFESGLRLAGFVEFAPTGLPPDPGKWTRLRRHADALGLPVDGEPSQWMGARPTLPDYLPAMGALPDTPDVLYALGHQHLGLTLAALTGERIAAMVAGLPAPAWLPALDLARFQAG